MKFSVFPKKSSSAISKSTLSVQMNSLWKLSFEKKLENKNFFRAFIGRISDLCRNISGTFVQTAFYLSIVTFVQKQNSRVK